MTNVAEKAHHNESKDSHYDCSINIDNEEHNISLQFSLFITSLDIESPN